MHFDLFTQLQQGTDAARQLLEQTAASTQDTPPPAISVWQLLQYGGWYIMGPLAIMSMVTFYLLIERFMALRAASKLDKDFMAKVRDYVHEGKLDSAKNLCDSSRSPIARMVGKGVSRIGSPIKEIESAMESIGRVEVARLEHGVGLLSLFSKLAPMFGFIGTIIGVITIFYNIALTDNMSIGGIADGLYKKLVTSGAGLIVGILSFSCYHVLNSMVDGVVMKMDQTAMEFVDVLQEPQKS